MHPPSNSSGLSLGNNESDFDPRLGEGAGGTTRSRRKSVNHMSREVVTIDEIRPDWEAKLASVKAVAARRANRRIVMRQVGDRLIPVGITSSRDPLQPLQLGADLGTDSDGGSTNSRSRRSRRGRDGEISQMLQGMGIGGNGADIEDVSGLASLRSVQSCPDQTTDSFSSRLSSIQLMMMEAMRLSLLEHEKQQAKEEADKKKAAQAQPSDDSTPPATSGDPPSSPPRTRTTNAT